MIKLSNALLLTLLVQFATYAQDGQRVLVQDDARVGLIVTGEGNTLHTTQIFGKSPEYAELKSTLGEYEEQIKDKVDLCDEMEEDGLPARYVESCTSELTRLIRKRDSIQKIEKKFRNDVLRLAALFDQVEINSERILIAQRLFEEGQITEADAILKVEEMQTETDQLLAKRNRLKATQQETDSLLTIKSEEWLTKAILTEFKYDLGNWQDSVLYYYQQSIRCKKRFANLYNYADFFYQQNRLDSTGLYLSRLIELFGEDFTIREKIDVYNFQGRLYTLLDQIHTAEEAYLKSLSFIDELEKSEGDTHLEYRANLFGNLGVIYRDQGRLDLAEQYQMESLHLTRQLQAADTVLWLEHLAMNHSNLAEVYRFQGDYTLAFEQHDKALKIRRDLAKESPLRFDGQVAKSLNSLGVTLRLLGRLKEGEEALKEGEEIWTRLQRLDEGRFALGLSMNQNALGNLYMQQGSYEASEAAHQKAIQIRRDLAEMNPSPFLTDLVRSLNNLAILYNRWNKPEKAKVVLQESIQSFEKLEALGGIVEGKKVFDAYGLLSGALFLAGEWEELKLAYKKMIKIAYKLAKNDPETFELEIAQAAFYSAYVNLQTNAEASALEDIEMTKKFTIKHFEKSQAKEIFFQMISYFGWSVVDSTLSEYDQEGFVLRQSYLTAQDPKVRLSKLQTLIGLGETAIKEGVENKYFISTLANDYNLLSYYLVLTRDFEGAEKAARRGIQLDATQPWLITNLAMSLLFQGNYEKAKIIYEEKKGKWMDGHGTYTKIFLDDLADMEAQGVTHPDVKKIRALLNEN